MKLQGGYVVGLEIHRCINRYAVSSVLPPLQNLVKCVSFWMKGNAPHQLCSFDRALLILFDPFWFLDPCRSCFAQLHFADCSQKEHWSSCRLPPVCIYVTYRFFVRERERERERNDMKLLMAEILHHPGCMKPYKYWDKLPTSTG